MYLNVSQKSAEEKNAYCWIYWERCEYSQFHERWSDSSSARYISSSATSSSTYQRNEITAQHPHHILLNQHKALQWMQRQIRVEACPTARESFETKGYQSTSETEWVDYTSCLKNARSGNRTLIISQTFATTFIHLPITPLVEVPWFLWAILLVALKLMHAVHSLSA